MAFPASINAISVRADGPSNIIYAAHLNEIRTALRDLNTELGDAPKGNLASIEARLDVLLDDNGILKAPSGMLFVGKTNCRYSTIQAALNACAVDDIIYVYPGTYVENITVTTRCSLVGIVDGRLFAYGPRLNGNITLDGIDKFYFHNFLTINTTFTVPTYCVVRLSHVESSSGDYDIGAYSSIHIRDSSLNGDINLGEESEVYAYNSKIGSLVGASFSSSIYYCICINIPNGLNDIGWSRISGTCTVSSNVTVYFSRVATFAGSSGKGSYNIHTDGTVYAVP